MSCALRLARAGNTVTLLDPGNRSDAASSGNAGHIAIEQTSPLASWQMVRSVPRRLFLNGGPVALPPRMIGSWGPFALRLLAASTPARFERGKKALAALLGQTSAAWQRLTAELGEPSLMRLDGHFVAWESAATAAVGRRSWLENGAGTATFRDATRDELNRLRRLSPKLVDAIRFAGTGQIRDLEELADLLAASLRSAGVKIELHLGKLERAADGRVSVAGIDADLILVAAGVGSGPLMRSVGHKSPLIAERGYHIRSHDFDWPEDSSPLVFENRSMIVTRFKRCVQASGFVEFGTSEAPADSRKWERLERHVAELGLPMRPPFSRWIGRRPTLPDYLPAIGRSNRIPNLYYAFGHQHLGLTLAPITSELVAQLISGEEPAIDLSPFGLSRFEFG
jgi:D-amino-acid dehydrogenase